MRVAIVSYRAPAGDAIGNQVAEKLAFFRERGAAVRVFLDSLRDVHSDVRPVAEGLAQEPHGDGWRFITSADLVLVEYGQYYAQLGLLPLLAGGRPQILIDYHGVTPPELWGNHNREAMRKGERYRGLVWLADAVLVHSAFTRGEIVAGCRFPVERVHHLGFAVGDEFFAAVSSGDELRRALGLTDAAVLLFVGRLAP